jgi:hypothetical protein
VTKLVIGRGMKQRLTKAGLRAEEHFKKLADAYLATVGTKPGRLGYEWNVETRAGTLSLTAYGHSIAGRFGDVERAKALGLGYLNPYSGKWNHHYEIGAAEAELEDFKRQLGRVLPKPEGAP